MVSSSSSMDSPPSSQPTNPPEAIPVPLSLPQETVPVLPSSSRRLPPPCWTDDEIVALIDAYRERWYSLRFSNLKASDWQDVAEAIAQRCPNASPLKTAVQCRHKMEKLRKRYRNELQRARSMPRSRFTSSWVHFKKMDSMEKGPLGKSEDSDSAGDDNNDGDDDEDRELYGELKNLETSSTRSLRKLYGNGNTSKNGGGSAGIRIKIPSGVTVAKPGIRTFTNADPKRKTPYPESDSGLNIGTRLSKESDWASPGIRKRPHSVREGDPVTEMVSAMKFLVDGYLRVEQMKMEMGKEIEKMRMEMEMKRTSMILESQQQIMEAFANAFSEKTTK